MRILFLSTSMGMGGADQQILLLAQAMRARGHTVRILVLAPLGRMGYEAQQAGLPIESFDIRRNLGIVPRTLRVLRAIRAWRPDVVHSHMMHANLLARVLRPAGRIPALVSTIHSVNYGGRAHVLAYRWTGHLADRVTIISRLVADCYVSIGAVDPARTTVIPNAVDVECFRKQPEARARVRRELGVGDEFVWIAVGRFEPAKDYGTMIAAFAEVAASRPRSRLLLVGTGSLQGKVESEVRSRGLGDQVRFLGVRRDVPELMSAADAYVLSSAWEGMPVVLLEAASAELPVVATHVGGVAEVVDDGVTGLLVPAGDAASLARAMTRVETLSPDVRAAMGREGRALVERSYGTAELMSRWEKLYSDVVSDVARAGAISSVDGGQRKT